MQRLTEQGNQKVFELANRYGVSTDAVMAMLQAVVNGNGRMAQFNHYELGGGGQWMQGGMTMVGDMFNNGLKSKVDGLCCELSNLLNQQPFVPTPPSMPVNYPQQGQMQGQGGQMQGQGGQMQQQGGGGYNQSSMVGSPVSLFVSGGSGNWWPGDLGFPNGSGGQNNIRYAYFNNMHRLATEINGHVTVYDTLDHQIGGVSQQQSGDASLTFSSQYGTVFVSNLPIISIDGVLQNSSAPPIPPAPLPMPSAPMSMPSVSPAVPPVNSRAESAIEVDVFSKIERLADLKQKGIISDQEFDTKKTELLSRL